MGYDYFDMLPQPAWVYDVATLRFLAVNELAVKVYGYTREEFLQMTLLDIRPDTDHPRLLLDVSENKEQIQDSGVWRHRKKNGSVFDVHIVSKAILHDGITARVVIATEAAHAYQEDRLRIALAAGKLGVWEYNIADKTLLWDPLNTGAYGNNRELFPKTHEEFLLLVDVDFREPLDTAFKHCIDTGVDYSFEFRMTMPNGDTRWRHAFGKRILDNVGVPIKVIGVGLDTTELRAFEQKLAQAQKMQAIGRLAAGVAHDLNNILTVVTNHCDLVRGVSSVDEIRESVEQIAMASQKGADIVRQLVAYSRLKQSTPKQVDLNQSVRETSRMLKLLLPKSITLFTLLDTQPLAVHADSGHLEQILMNLCLNARDAIPGDGMISVTTRRVIGSTGSPLAELVVSDNGNGMDDSIKQQMFEPFFTTKSPEHGLGLGMSIVQDVVGQIGGQISVESKMNDGTTITIQLPILAPDSASTVTT